LTFEIKLPLFEGPFDLLLFFIERDELDIHDIPISKITDDFLEYIHQLEQMNIEVASEFILVAATLMRIKAKMLLPRPTLDEEGNEIDPREELVRHLLEYKRFKSVVPHLASLEEGRASKEKRGNVIKELRKLSEHSNVEFELQGLDLYRLLKVFENSLKKYADEQNRPIHKVVQYPYTIDGQRNTIINKLKGVSRVSFEEVISDDPNKIAVIFSFLAILDLLQQQVITLHLGLGYNNFWIEKLEGDLVENEH
jgi:segregation and condensation protein A